MPSSLVFASYTILPFFGMIPSVVDTFSRLKQKILIFYS